MSIVRCIRCERRFNSDAELPDTEASEIAGDVVCENCGQNWPDLLVRLESMAADLEGDPSALAWPPMLCRPGPNLTKTSVIIDLRLAVSTIKNMRTGLKLALALMDASPDAPDPWNSVLGMLPAGGIKMRGAG